MDRAVIQGTFADLKTVKTRSVVQLVIEVPIEEGERVIQAFGFPQPGREAHVAVARLMPQARQQEALPAPTHPPAHDGPPEKADDARRFENMPRSQQAGMLCADPAFQAFLNGGPVQAEDKASHTADMLRFQLGIGSRRDLNTNTEAGRNWDALVADFRQATGQFAEQRG